MLRNYRSIKTGQLFAKILFAGSVLLWSGVNAFAADCTLDNNFNLPGDSFIEHNVSANASTSASYCELCGYGYVTFNVINPFLDAVMTNITVIENLSTPGLVYDPTAPNPITVNGVSAPGSVPTGASSILTFANLPDLAPQSDNFTPGVLTVRVAVRRVTTPESLVSVSRGITANLTFDTELAGGGATDSSCTAYSSDSDAAVLPLREPVPTIDKTGWNYDAGQRENNAVANGSVYGNNNDDVVWRVRIGNTGLAGMQDLRLDDLMAAGNIVITQACPTAAAANSIANNNGSGTASGCVPATNTINDFVVTNPFGNTASSSDGNEVDVTASGNTSIYLVGKITADGSCITSKTNTVNDVQWGCQSQSPAGGISATSTGISPTDSATLFTRYNSDGNPVLQVNRQLTGTNTNQPVGSKGTMTITITNNSGGSVKNIHLKDVLPPEYVVDSTYLPTIAVTSPYGNYPGRVSRIVWTNPQPVALPLTNIAPEYDLTSNGVTHTIYADQVNMLRHGDRAVITFRVVLINSNYYDRSADLDVTPEVSPGTDPNVSPLTPLTNTLTVDFDTFCALQGAQSLTLTGNGTGNPNGSAIPAFPEDLDVAVGGNVFILTNDPNQLLTLPVLLTNRGGHDARDYHAFVTFGTTMEVVNVPTGCSDITPAGALVQPDPWKVWVATTPLPTTATIYECTSPATISPNQTVTLNFDVRKTTDVARIAIDDLSLRADVVGEITLSDATLLNLPAPIARADGETDRANNYSMDATWARVIGFNLIKQQLGACSENNPPTFDAITNQGYEEVQIGEECSFHLETGGWFGFETPGFAYIAVQNIDVVDEVPDGQVYISDLDGGSTGGITGVTFTPPGPVLTEGDFDWRFNVADVNRIEVADEWFRVNATTRVLNNPVDLRAPPNVHAANRPNILNSTFDATFSNINTAAVEKYTLGPGTIGYPNEPIRRVDLRVTEPNLIVTKQVCNETLNSVGTGCGNWKTLADLGDTNDSYIYRIILSNEANDIASPGVLRAPAYNVNASDTLDASDLMLIEDFSTDGLDNDGDGMHDGNGGDPDGESTISENSVMSGAAAIITVSNGHSTPLQKILPGSSVTFYYRVNPDDAIAPEQVLTNSVITSYDSMADDFGNQTTPQLGNSSTAPNDVGRARLYNTAPVTADVKMIEVQSKPVEIIALSNRAVSGSPQVVVVGEEIRYQLTTSLPVTRLDEFMIRDELPAGVRCIEVPAINLTTDAAYVAAGFVPGGPPISTTCTSTGTNDFVEWNFGAQELTMSTAPEDRFDFKVDFVARVENTAVTNQIITNNAGLLRNGGGIAAGGTDVTATYKNEKGAVVIVPFDQVDAVIREPQIALTKSFAPTVNSDAGDELTVTVTATNTGSAAAYNLRVLDDLLGSEMSYVAGSVSSTDPPDNVDLSTTNKPIFSWNRTNPKYQITPAEVRSFSFKVRVDASAQPLEILDNSIQAKWDSLPDRNTTLNSSGSIATDGSALGLRNGALPYAGSAINHYEAIPASAATEVPALTMSKTVIAPVVIPTIGAHQHFRVELTLPEGTTNNLVVTDNLAQGGFSYVLANNAGFDITYSFSGIASINDKAVVDSSFNSFPVDNTSATASWNIGKVVTQTENDLAGSAMTPKIVIEYFARADNVTVSANTGDILQNAVAVNYRHGETAASAPTLQATTAAVSVVEPDNIVVTKVYLTNVTNPGVAPDLGDKLRYRITVTNNGSSDAFDTNIVDNLPTELNLDTSFVTTALINGSAVAGFKVVPAGSPVGPLVWGRNNTDGSLDIPVGQSLVLTYQAVVSSIMSSSIVLNNSVSVDWTSLNGVSTYERTGAGCPTITAPNDYCVGPVTALVALVEPELILDKRGPAGSVQYGIGIPYTLVVENTGTGTAFGIRVVDKLPAVADNPPLAGGTCNTAPQNFNVRITTTADETTALRTLQSGVDYSVTHTAAPACELVVETISAQSGIVLGEKLIIAYDAFLDGGTDSGASLTNIAGVTRWYSQDISAGTNGAFEFVRSITDGTSTNLDHEDNFNVIAEAASIEIQKTVVNVSTGQTPGTDATPGDRLRYSITVTVPATSDLPASGLVVTDSVPANATYIADSVTLNGLPVGQPDAGVSPLIAGVDISSSTLTPPLPTSGNGSIPIGESATITFDVLLDPVITSGTVILNQAQVDSPATGPSLSDDPLAAGNADPTATLITSAPAFQVLKTSTDITADPAILNQGETLRYTITVKNIGTENAVNSVLIDQIPANTAYVAGSTMLNGIVVADPAAGVSALQTGIRLNAPENTTAGFLRADTDVAANNVATINFDVKVNNSTVIGTVISNQGFINGAGAGSGVFSQRPSDDPDTPLVDDPTLDVVGNIPLVDAVKTVAIVNDIGTIGVVDQGERLRYTITVSNSGAIPATGVVFTDAVPANTSYIGGTTSLNGLAISDPALNVSPLIAGIDISSSDLTPPLPTAGNGTLSKGNSATIIFDVLVDVAATPGTIISNQGFISDNELPTEPTDADGNDANGDQPTDVVVGNVQQLAITKQVFVVGGGVALAGGQLEYVVRVTNIGGIAASNVVITDDLNLPIGGQMTYINNSGLLDGLITGVSESGSVITANYSANYGDLPPAGVVELRFRVRLSSGLAIGTNLLNTAIVNWNSPIDSASASASIDIGGTPGSINLNGQVWQDTNLNSALDSSENLLRDFSVQLYRNNILLASTTTDVNGLFSFNGLPPNDPASAYQLRYTAPDAISTSATLGVTSSAFTDGPQRIDGIFAASGANLLNLNLPRQPNGVVYDSVLRTPVSGVRLTLINQTRSNQEVPTICFDDPNQQNQVTLGEGYYKFDLNFSDSRCTAGDDYVIQVQPPAAGFIGTTSVIIPPFVATTGAALNVPNCPGGSVDQIPTTLLCEISADATPQPTSVIPRAPTTNYYLKFLLNDTTPNSDQAYNNHIAVDSQQPAAVSISKVAGLLNVTRSQLVPYTITISNTLPASLTDLSVVDNFPAGFKYVAKSARVDGLEVEPQINGRTLTWANLSLGFNQTRVIKLLLIVGSGVGEGEYVNTAQVYNLLTNEMYSGVASATVRVIPDPTFDCTDIIGKVYEDKNLNAYQDEGEPGLPGVDVATARGLRVTTDAYGRFHITCAVVPNEVRGSNFIMKLDDRTLPSGYRVTSENPRVQRATRGKMMKFNFGATIHRVVRLDLADGVFEKALTVLRPQWRTRIDMLITELQKDPSVLRLSYLGENETEAEVSKRLNAIEDLISKRWEELNCCYKLTIEKEVFWRKGNPSDRKTFE